MIPTFTHVTYQLRTLICCIVLCCSIAPIANSAPMTKDDVARVLEVNQGLGFAKAVEPKLKKKLDKLAGMMCVRLIKYDGEKFRKRATKVMKSFMTKALKGEDKIEFLPESDTAEGKENIKKNNVKILSFLNEVKSHLFCDHPQRGKEHYMVFAENSNNAEKLFNDFLNMLNPHQIDGVIPDVNVIVGVSPNGTPETYLGYYKRTVHAKAPSKKLEHQYMAKIKEFQRMYDAKYYHELAP